MLDSYQSEKGSTSSLYESLFNHVFEVPSLLTDDTDKDEAHLHSLIEVYVCSRLIGREKAENVWKNYKKQTEVINDDTYFYRLNVYYLYLIHNDEVSNKDAEVVIYRLRQFINYLTVHSWGNCKRLSLLFESFTKPFSMVAEIPNALVFPGGQETKYMLHFGITETQRICMGSNLYIVFNHHLSRQFTGADKLVVSSLAALHYCLKFHRSAFSRHHLFRMTEMMSIYSSPELNSIFETTLTQVLWPYIRVIRNGMFRYRYFTWVEQEIRYIARVDDIESASYTFSLDAINDIKAHYRKTLANVKNTYETIRNCSEEKGPGLIAELNIVLGDIYFLERAYDEAVVFYQTAVNAHHALKDDKSYHLECLIRYVEALLKLGNVQEHRQRYERAAMNYYQANQFVDAFLEQQGKLSHNPNHAMRKLDYYEKDKTQTIQKLLTDGDAKWVLLKQPYWALLYLNLKRGYGHCTNITLPKHLYGESDPYGNYNLGQLFFYLGRYDKSKDAFVKVLNKITKFKDKDYNYYSSYLLPKTCVNLAQTILLEKMNEISSEFRKLESWEKGKATLTTKCTELVKAMKGSDLKLFKVDIGTIKEIITNDQFNMKEVLQLLFFSAQEYENHKQYDHAAMAYLRAISLWVVILDMLPLNYLEEEKKSILNGVIENMEE